MSHFDETKKALAGFLEKVEMEVPKDVSDFRAKVALAFMSGAAIAVEIAAPGEGEKYVRYGVHLMKNATAVRQFQARGGKLL